MLPSQGTALSYALVTPLPLGPCLMLRCRPLSEDVLIVRVRL
jgi:hypothetical protein